jgi:uncharacterized protein YeaO (DUF488 family)
MTTTSGKPSVRLKRVYLPPAPEDGRRVLVERLWPRGLTKAAAGIDLWLKEIAPSPKLRAWYGHEPARWPEFQARYRAELAANPAPVETLRALCRQGAVTLVFAARDETRNSARVLLEWLEEPR